MQRFNWEIWEVFHSQITITLTYYSSEVIQECPPLFKAVNLLIFQSQNKILQGIPPFMRKYLFGALSLRPTISTPLPKTFRFQKSNE